MYNILPWAKDKSCSLEHNIEDSLSAPNNWMEIAAGRLKIYKQAIFKNCKYIFSASEQLRQKIGQVNLCKFHYLSKKNY
jgi:hypothetical protein